MKSKLKVVLRCSLFVGIFLILLVLCSFIFRTKEITKSGKSLKILRNGIIVENEDMVDVVVMGDSLSYSSIIPAQMYRDYGIAAYISGTAAQQPNDTYRIIEEAFKTQNPKYVLLETNCIFRNYPVRDAVYSYIRNIFPVFTYHNRWKELKSDDFKMKFTYTYFKNSKGFRYSNVYCGANTSEYMIPSNEIEPIPEKNITILENIKKMCQEHNTELILISVPSVKCYDYKKHNAILRLTEALDVKYLDMNLKWEEIGINWKYDTRDQGDHLNYKGAVKVTEYLGEYLWNLGMLEDHRQENKYKTWNEDIEDFYEIVNSKE